MFIPHEEYQCFNEKSAKNHRKFQDEDQSRA